MAHNGLVPTCVDNFGILKHEGPTTDKGFSPTYKNRGKSTGVKNSEDSRPKKSNLSRLSKFIRGSLKIKKRGKHALKSDFPQANMAIEEGYEDDVAINFDCSRDVDINVNREVFDSPFVSDDEAALSPKYRRMSLPVGHTSALYEDNIEDIRKDSSMWVTSTDPSLHEENSLSRFERKSFSRGTFNSSKNFRTLPRALRSLLRHKCAAASTNQFENQNLDSSHSALRRLFLSSKQNFKGQFELSKQELNRRSSNNDDKHILESPQQFKEEIVVPDNQTLDSSRPAGDDKNTAVSELTAACNVQSSQEQVTTSERVAIWAVHFDKLLQDSLGIHTFTKFLEKEFSDENIKFWQVCEQYRGLGNEQQQKVMAKDIYNRHLAVRASEPVNVDNTARSHTEQFLDTPTAAMFDVAQNQILRLMKLDSYPRFLKSDLYKKLLAEEMDGKIHHEPERTTENKSEEKQTVGKEIKAKHRRSLLPWKRLF